MKQLLCILLWGSIRYHYNRATPRIMKSMKSLTLMKILFFLQIHVGLQEDQKKRRIRSVSENDENSVPKHSHCCSHCKAMGIQGGHAEKPFNNTLIFSLTLISDIQILY